MRKELRWILLIGIVGVLAVSSITPVLAQGGNPTAEVAKVAIQQRSGLPWYVGVLLLVAIFAGVTIYKNRYQASRKKPVLNAACCAPIIEDGDNPFHPCEDEDGEQPTPSS